MNSLHIFLIMLIFILINLISFAEPARILCMFPVPFHSHQKVFHVITEALAKRGHELVVLTTEAGKPMENITYIDIHDEAFNIFDVKYDKYLKDRGSFTTEPASFWRVVVHPMHLQIIETFLKTPEVQALITDKTQEFDVILTEACVSSQLVMAARFNAPVILVSSFFAGDANFLRMGAPIHPTILPDYNAVKINNLSLLDKFSVTYAAAMMLYDTKKAEAEGDKLIRKYFGEKAPTSRELQKNVQLMLMNLHQIWDHNRPVPPSMVYMGALHVKKPKPIPKELQSYLDSSTNGVVYLSLGSKIRFSDLSPDAVQTFINVFGSLPYDVLIKWNGGEFPNKTSNVRLEKWLPQNDILHHPKMKVFIMQGGLQSIDEAIAAKVPMIALPVFADQFYNADKFETFGIGKQLDINAISEDSLRKAITSLAEDQSYRDNIEGLSKIMAGQRKGGLEKAIDWIEYTATYGAGHLRSPFADASVVDYLMLDVVAIVAFVFLTVVALIVLTLRLLLKNIKFSIRLRTFGDKKIN